MKEMAAERDLRGVGAAGRRGRGRGRERTDERQRGGTEKEISPRESLGSDLASRSSVAPFFRWTGAPSPLPRSVSLVPSRIGTIGGNRFVSSAKRNPENRRGSSAHESWPPDGPGRFNLERGISNELGAFVKITSALERRSLSISPESRFEV